MTLVAVSIVYTTRFFFLTHLGLASYVKIAPIELHAYVSLSIGMVPAVIMIEVVIIATSATFK